MTLLSAKLRRDDYEGCGARLLYWCPGCDSAHGVDIVAGPKPGPLWGWNGSVDAPSFTPSVLYFTTNKASTVRTTLCHHFVTDGQIDYCTDSPHALAGKKVPLPDLPEWLRV